MGICLNFHEIDPLDVTRLFCPSRVSFNCKGAKRARDILCLRSRHLSRELD